VPLRTVVLDIEGTTSATSFLTDHLHPYSARRFAGWLDAHPGDAETAAAIAQVRAAIGEPAAGTSRIAEVLRAWLAQDRKDTALKTIQGLIWARGFAEGELTAHFYPDVVPALRRWHAAGMRLYVFSSGSVTAQRLWFGHSPAGDLLPLLTGHFDTANAGPKRAPTSYRAIAAATGTEPSGTVFLSDVTAELDAACETGWHTVGVRRPGEPHYEAGVGDHLEVSSFTELDLSADRPARTG
jgi:enolase-phosphatase E1